MTFDIKTWLGLLTILMTIASHIPYLLTTLNGVNRPHVFSWVIWTALTFIAFAAQMAGHAGPGAWATGMTAIICIAITTAAFRQGDKNITRSDWVMFLAGLSAIPVWMMTNDPFWSVLIVIIIDCVALWPTFRKSWHRPHEENSFMYGLDIPRNIITLNAVSLVSPVTVLYPSALLGLNIVMYMMLKLRRANLQTATYANARS